MVKNNNDEWGALSMSERALFIDKMIKEHSISDLKTIKSVYNEYSSGGWKDKNLNYPEVTIQEEPWANAYFKQHPEVAGMAIGGGMNGVDGPRRVIINPYSKNINKEAVLYNERIRHYMEENNFKLPGVTQQQMDRYKGTAYQNDTLNVGRTEAARYLSGDKHFLTDEQIDYVKSFAPEGPIETTKWKALGKVDIKAIPDSTFTREKTGLGDIEYFAAEHPEGITYPNGYYREHPSKGHDVILYNPATNDDQDVRLDALHAMPKDLTYAVLNDIYRYHAQEGDVMHNAYQRYSEDAAKYGVENIDPLNQYFNNEADGLLRNMFIEGTPEYIKSKRYYPNKEELKQWNAHLMPYINEIQKYLETGEKPWYILEPAVVTAEAKSKGGKINRFDGGGKKSDSYESEMTYSQANALNKYYGKEGPAFMTSIGTEENPEFLYPEELEEAVVTADKDNAKIATNRFNKYSKNSDSWNNYLFGVNSPGDAGPLGDIAAAGIGTALLATSPIVTEMLPQTVKYLFTNPVNAESTLETIGFTALDSFGVASGLDRNKNLINNWTSGNFNWSDIPEFGLNFLGAVPAINATYKAADSTHDIVKTMNKAKNATRSMSVGDPGAPQTYINAPGNAERMIEYGKSPKAIAIENQQIAGKLSKHNPSKLTKMELEGKTKHDRTNINNIEAFKATFDTTPRTITGYAPYDRAAEEFIKAIDEGRLYHDYNIDFEGWNKEPFLAHLNSTKEWKPSKHIKTYIDTLDDIPEAEKLPALRMQENGYVAPIVELYRRYLARLGYNPHDLSDYDISKLLSHTYNDISSQLTGKTAKQLFYHGISGKSPKEDYKSSFYPVHPLVINKPPLSSFDIFKTGTTTGNMGRAGAGMNFSTVPVFSGKNSGFNIQPYLIGDIDDVVKSTTLGYSGDMGNHIKDYHIDIAYNNKGVSAKEFAHRLIKSLPDESDKLIIDVSEAAQGVIPGYDRSKALNVLYRGPMNKVKSIFPHPDRFVLNGDGTVTFIPVDFNDVRHNFRLGGKLNLNALGGPLYNKHNPIESFTGSSKIPVVRKSLIKN